MNKSSSCRPPSCHLCLTNSKAIVTRFLYGWVLIHVFLRMFTPVTVVVPSQLPRGDNDERCVLEVHCRRHTNTPHDCAQNVSKLPSYALFMPRFVYRQESFQEIHLPCEPEVLDETLGALVPRLEFELYQTATSLVKVVLLFFRRPLFLVGRIRRSQNG